MEQFILILGVVFSAVSVPTTPPAAGPCGVGQATCSNGQCIPLEYRCDGDRDCEDGSDETQCTGTGACEPNEFRCNNQRCAMKIWMCDGDDDCGDNSDEQSCPQKNPGDLCSAFEFQCTTGDQCVILAYQCDGDIDCQDRSDEIGCSPPIISLPPVSKVDVELGGTLTIICEAVGTPTPFIVWRLNMGNIPTGPRVFTNSVDGRGNLTITDARVEDSGTYTCEAINTRGSIFATPDANIIFRRLTTVAYTNLTETTRVDATWDNWGSWSHCSVTCGYKGVQTRKRACNGGRNCTGNSQEVKTCPTNSCPDKPFVKSADLATDVCENAEISLPCMYESTTNVTDVYWMKNEVRVLFPDRMNGSTASLPSLTINKAKLDDSGVYRCHVVNAVGESHGDSIKLNVTAMVTFAPTHDLIHVSEGTDTTLKCVFESCVKPSLVFWTKRPINQRVDVAERIRLPRPLNDPSLVVQNVRKADSGTYTCHVDIETYEYTADHTILMVKEKTKDKESYTIVILVACLPLLFVIILIIVMITKRRSSRNAHNDEAMQVYTAIRRTNDEEVYDGINPHTVEVSNDDLQNQPETNVYETVPNNDNDNERMNTSDMVLLPTSRKEVVVKYKHNYENIVTD